MALWMACAHLFTGIESLVSRTMDWLTPPDISGQINIRPFSPQDQAAAKQLILDGLSEHWGWLDPTKNPDLDDIASSYAKGVFLVAEYNGELVGSGGLLPVEGGQAQIVRVHVAGHLRREGIGSMIVHALCEQARRLGFEDVILETTETWKDAIAFYEHLGFQVTHSLEGDVYMAKRLDADAGQAAPPGTSG